MTLGVADVEEAAAFYERLGWTRSPASVAGEVAFFGTNGAVVALWGTSDLASDAGLSADGTPPFRGVALAVNLESEAEVDRVLAEAVAAGATLTKPATRAEWGGYSGYFADPDGHLWEAAFNPGWPLDANGTLALPR